MSAVHEELRIALARIAYFRLTRRAREEANRGPTSLELMFDLATVVAVGAAAHGLAQDVSAGHLALGVVRFACSFFMAWLAWMNYTWFASGYDDKSRTFRALSMVIIFGSLTLAAGVQDADGVQPIWLGLIGFTIMRLGMVALWLGAANGDQNGRVTALRYAGAISEQLLNRKLAAVLTWAYGHYVLFAAGAATAAGFSVALTVARERSLTSTQGAALAMGVPIALYLAALWLVRDRASRGGSQHWLLLVAAALILAGSALSSYPLEWIAGLLVCAVMARRHVYPTNQRNSEI